MHYKCTYNNNTIIILVNIHVSQSVKVTSINVVTEENWRQSIPLAAY